MALRWRLRRWARELRWQGLTGLGLLAAAAALYGIGTVPGKARVALLQQEASSVREFARKSGSAANAAVEGEESRLDRFYRLLPAKSSAPDWLRIVFLAARAQSLTLDQGDYKMKVDRNARLVLYEIVLPVRGSYVQVRQFIAWVLDRIPAAALDELVIKRETIGDPRIEASIRFTLFLNGG